MRNHIPEVGQSGNFVRIDSTIFNFHHVVAVDLIEAYNTHSVRIYSRNGLSQSWDFRDEQDAILFIDRIWKLLAL